MKGVAAMSERRKDRKGRNLKDGETVMPDGRYRFRYTDRDGNRKAVYSWKLVPTDKIPKGKKDGYSLRELEDQVQYDRHDGIDTARADRVTINDLFGEMLETKQDLKISSRSTWEYMHGRFIKDRIGRKKITAVKYSTVKRYYNELLKSDELKPGTISIIHTILTLIFALAVKDGYIRNNPASGAFTAIRRANKGGKKRHALTVDQQSALVTFVAESDTYRRWLPLITFLLGTGCRIGEAIGLTWSDCDFDNDTVRINHSLQYRSIDGKMTMYISTPKSSAGVRTIPMLPEVREALLQIRKDQMWNGCKDIELDGHKGFIFRNRKDELFFHSNINGVLERIRVEYNAIEEHTAQDEDREPLLLPHFSAHTLRHTFCTRFCENESNIKVIQSIMGHSDIQTTMNIYAEATEEKKQEVFSNLQGKMKIS